ncbi:guanine nucleotide exchange factor [Lyophyllum atratum]|nr:guanine nucleotide exchange factor [Lyophyllum atratum]
MADILRSYTALSGSSTRSDVSAATTVTSPFAIDPSTRTELIKCLLRDLKAVSSSSGTKILSSKDAAQALLAVKTLGKNPAGSEYLASPANLSTLLTFSSSFKDDPEASGEALRCIANALLLIEKGRSTFLQKEVDGGPIAISMLEKTSLPDHIFILCRILFLCTASGPSFIKTMVDSKYHGRAIVEIIGMAREAMTDLLKLTFNILLHYPKMVESEPQTAEATNPDEEKVLGDFWSPKLDGILPPLIRTFTSLPPTFPSPISAPLTHVIHSLITIPINPDLRPIWFGTNSSTSPRQSASNSPKNTSRSQTPQPAGASSSSSRSISPTRSSLSQTSSQTSPKHSTLDRALSVLAAGRRSLSRSPPTTNPPTNILQRACDLLDVAFSHYFPGTIDVDESEVRERCKQEHTDNTLDDVLSPLVVLISRFCIADEASRVRVRQWIVPDDLDRSSPLEARADILGRCLRLLSSVYHTRLKDSVGELLYAMCDSDASNLSALVGYGNVAGFLFHKGILNAPPAAVNSTFNPSTPNASINPITGTTAEPPASLDMSDEEKEREMEKLFVLFDRLERTGAIPPSQNPMRKAIHDAKFGG